MRSEPCERGRRRAARGRVVRAWRAPPRSGLFAKARSADRQLFRSWCLPGHPADLARCGASAGCAFVKAPDAARIVRPPVAAHVCRGSRLVVCALCAPLGSLVIGNLARKYVCVRLRAAFAFCVCSGIGRRICARVRLPVVVCVVGVVSGLPAAARIPGCAARGSLCPHAFAPAVVSAAYPFRRPPHGRGGACGCREATRRPEAESPSA